VTLKTASSAWIPYVSHFFAIGMAMKRHSPSGAFGA
jgi:hypothetical protein